MARPGAGRAVGGERRLLPAAVPVRGATSCGRGSWRRARRAGWRSRSTRSATWSGGGGPSGVSGRGVLTGSHLDSVLDGGAYDGPLGVVSALAAIDLLRERGFVPSKPIGVSVFAEEEGSRFGLACLGSRLAAGASLVVGGAGAAGPGRGVPAGRAAWPPVSRSDRRRQGVGARGPGRVLRGAARRAGAGPRRPRRRRRGGQRDLAARALPLRLHRRGQPRGHDPDGGPPRPDADLRDDRAGRERAGPGRWASGRRSAGSRSRPTARTRCRRG